MAFYDPNGRKIETVEEFVKIYSKGYFVDNDKIEGFNHSRTYSGVEEIIMKILESGIKDYKDFARIMAWKMGKIRHKESEDIDQIVYAKDWIECENKNPRRYGRELGIKEYWEYILDNYNELEDSAINNPQKCLTILNEKCPNGIGIVYMVTIMFFISKGKMPIYDRMAMKALLANEQDLMPNGISNVVQMEKIPDKKDKRFNQFVETFYKPQYIMRLNALNYDYISDRNLDRALWVYGHGFKEMDCNKK